MTSMQPPAPPAAVAGKKPRVLIVDDEQDNLDLMSRVLGRDFQVECVTSANAALEVIARGEPAVLVTDQRMPGMTGLEFLQQVAERYPETRMRRILVTAYPDISELEAFLNRGHIVRFLRKPYQPSDLRTVVREAADEQATPVDTVARGDSTYDDELRGLSRELVVWALQAADGVVAHAANKLGIERSRLVKIKQRLGIE